MLMFSVLTIIGAYLIGSISSAVWIGKHFYGVDVREHGSGNAGFTNTVRVLGWKAGLPVFIIDIFKGWLAVKLSVITGLYHEESYAFVNFQLILGAAAVLGHIFPIYTGFKGGKGVATILGLILAVDPITTLVCMSIFLLVFLTTRYVSLSSLIAGLSFPVIMIFVFKTTIPSLIIFSLIVTTLLFLTHQKNIQRLIDKEENRAKIFKKHRENNEE